MKKTLIIILLVVIPVITLILKLFISSDVNLQYIFIDVSDEGQQGLANLFIYNKGNKRAVVMVDVGSYNTSSHLIEVLKNNGIDQIDYLLITHYHRDHIGAIDAIIQNGIKIKTVYYNRVSGVVNRENWEDYTLFINILSKLIDEGAEIKEYSDNWQLEFDKSLKIKLIYKHDGISESIGKTSLNDTGVVFKFVFRKNLITSKSFLITGDIGEKASRYIVENKKELIKDIDILQVPHHGATPWAVDELYYLTNPDISLVPAYRSLWDGERCEKTKEILNKVSDKIYVSDIDGDIILNF